MVPGGGEGRGRWQNVGIECRLGSECRQKEETRKGVSTVEGKKYSFNCAADMSHSNKIPMRSQYRQNRVSKPKGKIRYKREGYIYMTGFSFSQRESFLSGFLFTQIRILGQENVLPPAILTDQMIQQMIDASKFSTMNNQISAFSILSFSANRGNVHSNPFSHLFNFKPLKDPSPVDHSEFCYSSPWSSKVGFLR